MHSFRNDYMEGAHPLVLEALVNTNSEQHIGYTEDSLCKKGRSAIRSAIVRSDDKGALRSAGIIPAALQVEFVAGGTIANLVSIAASLRPHECAVAAPDAHINVHETGAIEACGHKVLITNDADGLLSVAGIDAVMKDHECGRNFHMVKPRLLYVSFATETGLVLSLSELNALRAYATSKDLLLFIDGARLAVGLTSKDCDVTLADICAAADIFTIGGTKNGALFGEAIVVKNPDIQRDFRYVMKQKGAVMAKGRLLGVQFDALFSTTGAYAGVEEALEDEPLYLSLGRRSNAMAMRLKEVLKRHGFDSFVSDSPTNQQYPIMPDDELAEIGKSFGYEYWERVDETHSGVRFCASWATTQENVDALRAAVQALKK